MHNLTFSTQALQEAIAKAELNSKRCSQYEETARAALSAEAEIRLRYSELMGNLMELRNDHSHVISKTATLCDDIQECRPNYRSQHECLQPLVRALKSIGGSLASLAEEAFMEWNNRADGLLTYEQMSAGLSTLPAPPGPHLTRGMFNAIDENEDGVVHLQEFIRALNSAEMSMTAVEANSEDQTEKETAKVGPIWISFS